MNVLERAAAGQFNRTGEIKKLSVSGEVNNKYDVYSIPLEYLYYNDQNGRINTTYKKHKANHQALVPEPGNSDYNKLFEKFIWESNEQAMKETLQSIKDKTQQEPGVILPDGRVIDGNRRFTALRKYAEEDGIPKCFNAIILCLDVNSKADEKRIKELELDLQLGREERVNYDPIDRIFDVYNTIMVEKLMTAEEYKKASGAGNTKGINRDIRLAELIIRFIGIVSPGGNPIDKFYLARDLKLDGPLEEIEATINKMKSENKEAVTDAVLVHLVAVKSDDDQKDSTRVMRELKKNVLNKSDVLEHYLLAVDDKVDTIIESFEANPIVSANDLKKTIIQDSGLSSSVEKLKFSANRIIYKSQRNSQRTEVVNELLKIKDSLEEINVKDFSELTVDENIDAKGLLNEITDVLFKLKRDLRI